MLPKLPLADWQHILIDTSILVDYFSDPNRHEKNPIVKKRIEITKSVINTLAELELPEKRKGLFMFPLLRLASCVNCHRQIMQIL
jgi:hypothetical protein